MIRDAHPHRPFRHKFMKECAEPEKITETDIAVAQDAAAQMDEQIKAKEQEWFIAHRTSVHPSLHQYIIRECGVIKKTGTKWVRLRLDEHILGVMTFRKEADGMNIICTPPVKTYGF